MVIPAPIAYVKVPRSSAHFVIQIKRDLLEVLVPIMDDTPLHVS